MKANELRLGNWVDFNGEKARISQLWEMEAIFKCGDSALYSELNPIPLTEEILLKAGGQKKEHVTLELTKGRKLLFTTRHTKYYQVFLLHNDDMIALSMDEIYLHQLQNLFFALTGEEIKIEV